MRHYARKVDANQSTIVKELRQAGFRVQTGHDDLLVYRNGKLLWVEIKNPDGRNALTEGQKDLSQQFAGSYLVARSTEEILKWNGWTGT